MEAGCLNRSLGNFSQLVMIKFYQELVQIAEAGTDFEKPEAFLSEAWTTPRKRDIEPASPKTGMSMEGDTRDKTEERQLGLLH